MVCFKEFYVILSLNLVQQKFRNANNCSSGISLKQHAGRNSTPDNANASWGLRMRFVWFSYGLDLFLTISCLHHQNDREQ